MEGERKRARKEETVTVRNGKKRKRKER